jgi:hypothetical protein
MAGLGRLLPISRFQSPYIDFMTMYEPKLLGSGDSCHSLLSFSYVKQPDKSSSENLAAFVLMQDSVSLFSDQGIGGRTMKIRLVTFGEIDIEGQHYDHDVVVEKGQVRKRNKKLSKAYRGRFGHTPLSVEENIPWHGKKLFVGTGAYGSLPIMPEVYKEARRKGVEVIAKPTVEVCELVKKYKPNDVNAILHVTC